MKHMFMRHEVVRELASIHGGQSTTDTMVYALGRGQHAVWFQCSHWLLLQGRQQCK